MAEPGDVQAHNVLDNLTYRREIPVMLGVFINPARTPDQPEPTPRDWGDRTTLRKDEYNRRGIFVGTLTSAKFQFRYAFSHCKAIQGQLHLKLLKVGSEYGAVLSPIEIQKRDLIHAVFQLFLDRVDVEYGLGCRCSSSTANGEARSWIDCNQSR